MPGSDDQYDQVHTYSQDHAGKSKTTKPAVREIGRDGAPVQLYVGEARDSASIRTPPSGVGYIFFDQSDDTFKQIDSAGTVTSLAGGKSTEQVQDDVGSIMNEPLDYDDATPAYDISLASALTVNGGNLDVAADGIVQSMIADNAVGNTQMADDAVTPTEVDGSGGTDGQVLTSTGSEAQWESAGGNVPDWQEDANSPYTATGANSISGSVNGSYDLVLIHGEVADNNGNANNVDMQVDNDTNANYNFIDCSGTRTTGATEWTRIEGLNSNGNANFIVTVHESFGGLAVDNQTGDPATSTLHKGFNSSQTPPLKDFTFKRGVSSDWTVELYGRDIA